MLGKLVLAVVVVLGGVALAACGDSGGTSGPSNGGGGSSASGATGGTGTGATGGTGTGATGGTTGTGATGGTTMSTTTSADVCMALGDPCTECLMNDCHDLYCGCYFNLSCGALVQCSQNCGGDVGCNQNCFSNNEMGISQAALLGDCAATTCQACMGGTALPACEKCLFTSCPSQMNTCLANEDCAALLQCVQDCGPNPTDECLNICYFQHSGGLDDGAAVSECLNNNCKAQCG